MYVLLCTLSVICGSILIGMETHNFWIGIGIFSISTGLLAAIIQERK